jgi:hypothetical protein
MIRLKTVIAVRELPPNCSSSRTRLPTIRSLVCEQAHDEESTILRYLQQGVFGCFYPDPGLAQDVISPGTRVEKRLPLKALGVGSGGTSASIDPSAVLTDGVWLWPSVLAYYVAKYHLVLDPDFIQHAKANNWTVNESEVRLEDLSFDAFDSPDH